MRLIDYKEVAHELEMAVLASQEIREVKETAKLILVIAVSAVNTRCRRKPRTVRGLKKILRLEYENLSGYSETKDQAYDLLLKLLDSK